MLKRFLFSAAASLLLISCGGKTETAENSAVGPSKAAEKTEVTKQTEAETEVDPEATFDEMFNEEDAPAFDDEVVGTAFDAYGSDIEDAVEKAKETYDEALDDAAEVYGGAVDKAKEQFEEAVEVTDEAIKDAFDKVEW